MMNVTDTYISTSVWEEMKPDVRQMLLDALPGVRMKQCAASIIELLNVRNKPEAIAESFVRELRRIHTERKDKAWTKAVNKRSRRRRWSNG